MQNTSPWSQEKNERSEYLNIYFCIVKEAIKSQGDLQTVIQYIHYKQLGKKYSVDSFWKSIWKVKQPRRKKVKQQFTEEI